MAGGLVYSRDVFSDYYYGSDPDNITRLKSKNFIAAMKLLLVNYPELLQKVISKEYEYEDIVSVVNYYNGMRMEASRKKD
jgi:hypothetical protein